MTQAIVELLDRNPREWTEADLDNLCGWLRDKHDLFVKNKAREAAGGTKARTSNPVAKRVGKDTLPDVEVELDLG